MTRRLRLLLAAAALATATMGAAAAATPASAPAAPVARTTQVCWVAVAVNPPNGLCLGNAGLQVINS